MFHCVDNHNNHNRTLKVYNAEHCSHCTKNLKIKQEKKARTDRSSRVDLNVDNVLHDVTPAEESSVSVTQLPEEHYHSYNCSMVCDNSAIT